MTSILRGLLFGSALLLTACVPWTIRPIGEVSAKKADRLSPTAYVDAIWASKLIPAMRAQAVDAAEALKMAASSPAKSGLLIVKGQGVLLRVDASSRAGVAYVDLSPTDGRADLTIQTGPVMRGVALRDCTGLIRFSDFTNQIEFADIANELNARALQVLAGRLDAKTPPGTPIQFLGALELERNANPPLRWLAPVEIGGSK